jgi:hypothetical protein
MRACRIRQRFPYSWESRLLDEMAHLLEYFHARVLIRGVQRHSRNNGVWDYVTMGWGCFGWREGWRRDDS